MNYLLSFFGFLLLSQDAAAHHVYGIEVSPAFELFHALAEPMLCAFFGACVAALLARPALGWLSAALVSCVAAIALAFASVLEAGAGLFLLWDMLAFALFFALVRLRFQARRRARF